MKKKFAMFVAILVGLLGGGLAPHLVCAQGPGQPSSGAPLNQPAGVADGLSGGVTAPVLQYVAPGIFEIGNCKIIKEESKVEFPASVNMKEGLLEYLLVGSTGKLHESLLRTDVEPYALQVALLLSGLEGSLNPLSSQGDNRLPEGDPVDIRVSWNEDGKEKKARIEEMVLLGKNKVDLMPWVFTGSVINNGTFSAQAEKSIIAVFHDPVAMIDHRLESGANDEAWFVNSAKTPPVGTPITVSISKKAR